MIQLYQALNTSREVSAESWDQSVLSFPSMFALMVVVTRMLFCGDNFTSAETHNHAVVL